MAFGDAPALFLHASNVVIMLLLGHIRFIRRIALSSNTDKHDLSFAESAGAKVRLTETGIGAVCNLGMITPTVDTCPEKDEHTGPAWHPKRAPENTGGVQWRCSSSDCAQPPTNCTE